MSEIKRNAFRCKKCGMVVESKSAHDFEQCRCGNFTDGGLEYVRRGGKIEDMEDLSEPHMYFNTSDTVSGDSFGEELKEQAGRQALNDFREKEYRETEERLENLMHDNHRDLSHEADADKAFAFRKNIVWAIADLTTALEHLETANKQGPSRATSIAITKVEEAIMWLRKGE